LVVPDSSTVVVAEQPHAQLNETDSQATSASIARYLASGERVRMLTGVGFKVCIVLAVLVVLAWALGLLPVTTRPF
jgi:hypothetical protein